MAKGGGGARQWGGDQCKLSEGRRKICCSKKGEKAIDFGIVGTLIQSDAEIPIWELAEVCMVLRGFGEYSFQRRRGALNVEGVEIGRMGDRKTESSESSREPLGVLMDTEGDLMKAFGAVMDGVHRGESGE